MFDIGWSEMAIVLLVALIVIGPRDLPRVARTIGRWVAKGRAMAREFQTALEDMAREAELDKVKSEIEQAGRMNLSKTIEKTIDPSGDLAKAFDPTAGSDGATSETAAPAPGATSNPEPSAEAEAPSSVVEPGASAKPEPSPPAEPGTAAASSPTAEAKTPARETVPAEPS